MRALTALVTAAALVATACSAAPRPTPVVAVKQADPLAALLRDRCADCHDGSNELPQIDGRAALDRTLAVKAALMVAANRMPPAPAELAERDRQMLIGGLCQSGAPDPATCRNAMNPFRGSLSMSPPQELITALDRVAPTAPRPADAKSSIEPMLLGHVQSKRLVVHLDPTFETLWLLLTAERCPPPAAGSQAYETCVAAIAGGELGRLPRPAASAASAAPQGRSP
jgi:hypothetical protein